MTYCLRRLLPKVYGTLNVSEALQATGADSGQDHSCKEAYGFADILYKVNAIQPKGREIYIVLDNLSTDKGDADWLAAHPNVMLHFTHFTELA